jgi:hypothetical protein
VFLCVTSHEQAYKTTCVSVLTNDYTTGSQGGLKNRIRQRVKRTCTKKLLHKRVPVLNWGPKYNAEDAVGDLVAGITVGLTVIPQSLAYANLAGLPPQVCIPSLVIDTNNWV